MSPKKKWNSRSPRLNERTGEASEPTPITEQALYLRALRHLTRRAYPAAELAAKLRETGASTTAINAVLARLLAAGYLDDRRFLEQFILARRQQKLFGRARIERELREKGLPAALVADALDQFFPREEEPELLEQAMAKKLKLLMRSKHDNCPPGIDAKLAARLYNYLARLGFPYESIRAAMGKKFKGDWTLE